MKSISFSHIQDRLAEPDLKSTEQYEHWVNLTAKLIKRPYFATHKLVEDWPLSKIIQRYELCTKHKGDMPGDVKWWWLRKKEG